MYQSMLHTKSKLTKPEQPDFLSHYGFLSEDGLPVTICKIGEYIGIGQQTISIRILRALNKLMANVDPEDFLD